MHRSRSRRGSAARIIGWGFVVAAYVTVLIWAGGISAIETAPEQVAAAVVVAPAEGVNAQIAAGRALPTPAEAPLVTLAIAAAMVVSGAGWYVIHTYRARHPRIRSARLIVRHITTLM